MIANEYEPIQSILLIVIIYQYFYVFTAFYHRNGCADLLTPNWGNRVRFGAIGRARRMMNMYNIRKMGQIVSPIAYFLEGQ